ncbi:hypothetical protein OAC86_00190 [bacterium]|nr:hypothetical protein [bacterium]MDB9899943.1 hypothetical protein [bacterium]
MAKIFYVTESAPDYARVNFFKTEKEALEYGISELPQFDMFDEPMNDEEADGEEWYQGDSLTFKKGILFSHEEGELYVRAIEDAEAREYVEGLGEYSGAIFFDGFTRGMYGYLGRGVDGRGFKWEWDGDEINESNKNKNILKMKNIKTFEAFTTEKATEETVTEAVNASGYIKAGKLGYNDQFVGRQSLSMTLSLDLGFNKKDQYGGGNFIGFDHVSMYGTGKEGTILADALTGKYTYDELKAAAAEHFGL